MTIDYIGPQLIAADKCSNLCQSYLEPSILGSTQRCDGVLSETLSSTLQRDIRSCHLTPWDAWFSLPVCLRDMIVPILKTGVQQNPTLEFEAALRMAIDTSTFDKTLQKFGFSDPPTPEGFDGNVENNGFMENGFSTESNCPDTPLSSPDKRVTNSFDINMSPKRHRRLDVMESVSPTFSVKYSAKDVYFQNLDAKPFSCQLVKSVPSTEGFTENFTLDIDHSEYVGAYVWDCDNGFGVVKKCTRRFPDSKTCWAVFFFSPNPTHSISLKQILSTNEANLVVPSDPDLASDPESPPSNTPPTSKKQGEAYIGRRVIITTSYFSDVPDVDVPEEFVHESVIHKYIHSTFEDRKRWCFHDQDGHVNFVGWKLLQDIISTDDGEDDRI